MGSVRDLVLMARARDGSGWLRWRGVVTPGVTTFPEPTEYPDEGLLPVRSLPTVQWIAAGRVAGFSVENDALILEIDGTIVTSRLGPTGWWVVRAARDGAMVEVLSREVRGRAIALVVTGVGSSTRLVLLEKDPEEAVADIRGIAMEKFGLTYGPKARKRWLLWE